MNRALLAYIGRHCLVVIGVPVVALASFSHTQRVIATCILMALLEWLDAWLLHATATSAITWLTEATQTYRSRER